MIKSNIETNRNPGHNQIVNQIKCVSIQSQSIYRMHAEKINIGHRAIQNESKFVI